jgi:outer membrane protein assembly factor BamB
MATLISLAAATGRAGQNPTELTNGWRFTYGRGNSSMIYNASAGTPAVASDGTVYEGSFDGTFFALAPDGRIQWKFKAGREIHSSPAIGTDGTIYFGVRDGKFYALTPAGKLKWTFLTGAWVDSSPAIAADGTVYFGSWDHQVYALNPDGSLKWKFATGAVVNSSPAIAADGTLYFGSHDRKFYALTPDGRVRWTFLTGGEIISSPAIGTNGTVYFSSLDGNLYAVNPDGTEQWHRHTGGADGGSPVVDEAGCIYVALNHRTEGYSSEGQRLWGCDSESMTPAVARGQVYFSRTWTRWEAWSTGADRSWQWFANVQAVVSSAAVIARNGTVYVSCGIYLHAIQPPNFAPPATSSWPMFRANPRHTGRVGDN